MAVIGCCVEKPNEFADPPCNDSMMCIKELLSYNSCCGERDATRKRSKKTAWVVKYILAENNWVQDNT